ncbi:hypothetical protein CCR75_009793 [Bremia lactucae]|uniref:Chitin-binding type-4 domain-containing protein n=1 Tax=Bremia lactucae TaxID=4779 RepID=A0A976IBT0_BRELC|nr:hypothetical protein CCR75_009793 [Bremia lactucae]
MKTLVVSFTIALMLLALPTSVNAHGQLIFPVPRLITQQYRAKCGALDGAGDQELQYAPVELLKAREQADRPSAPTFNMMNGCRGTIYEPNNTVTPLVAGSPFQVEWFIQAPHPGTMVLSIVKPSTDSNGTITYVSVSKLLTIDPFAVSSADKTNTLATVPTNVTECETPGKCALQFYWHSDLASQTYPTCADITVTKSTEFTAQESETTAPTPDSPAVLNATPESTSPAELSTPPSTTSPAEGFSAVKPLDTTTSTPAMPLMVNKNCKVGRGTARARN